jgi:hypothetical protein
MQLTTLRPSSTQIHCVLSAQVHAFHLLTLHFSANIVRKSPTASTLESASAQNNEGRFCVTIQHTQMTVLEAPLMDLLAASTTSRHPQRLRLPSAPLPISNVRVFYLFSKY